ncbi:hypothetical protein [Shewanella sp. 1180_01]|uniref:hypothetical protein n=1 Tax=Shewanella sp. 1180_01 TaxID=2604451 RepID=UPI0040634739
MSGEQLISWIAAIATDDKDEEATAGCASLLEELVVGDLFSAFASVMILPFL